MRQRRAVKQDGIRDLVGAVLAGGRRVIAPVREEGEYRFRQVRGAEEVHLPEVNTVNSIKEFFFPKSDMVMRFARCGKRAEIAPAELVLRPDESGLRRVANDAGPFVVFGARPCDAASLSIMDKVFNWDSVDGFWQARREAATVVVAACAKSDEYCFCTSVGLSPDSRTGADAILIPCEGGLFAVEAVTAKGEALVGEFGASFQEAADARPAVTSVARRTDADKMGKLLGDKFDGKLWEPASERCIGCGICTYYCPTCHCFDIQDEGDYGTGARFKTWDSCSFALFTRHASGHNPRPDRASRWRQRIMHKFAYYPQRFGVVSCTGCGRCGRLCPVDLGVEATLRHISESST